MQRVILNLFDILPQKIKAEHYKLIVSESRIIILPFVAIDIRLI